MKHSRNSLTTQIAKEQRVKNVNCPSITNSTVTKQGSNVFSSGSWKEELGYCCHLPTQSWYQTIPICFVGDKAQHIMLLFICDKLLCFSFCHTQIDVLWFKFAVFVIRRS